MKYFCILKLDVLIRNFISVYFIKSQVSVSDREKGSAVKGDITRSSCGVGDVGHLCILDG